MRYFVLPLLGSKSENQKLVNEFKQNTTHYIDDDMIAGFYTLDCEKTIKSINSVLNFYNLKPIQNNVNNFSELTQNFINSINESKLGSKLKLSIILTYFLQFGLFIRPIRNKNEELNNLFFINEIKMPNDTNWWFNNLILLDGYYNPMTHSPFNENEIDDFLNLNKFKTTQELIFQFI